MSDIYDQHKAAFANVSAFVVLKDGERVATVAFKFGNAVTAYVHWIGTEMVRATAKGGGYDRQSAAVGSAASKIAAGKSGDFTACAAFIDAARRDGGATWDQALRAAGFQVIQAV